MTALPTRRKVFDLVGEAGTNADGVRRQDELLRCEPGEAVELRREPDNDEDPDAVLVLSPRGVPIGYLGREDAALVASALDRGRPFRARLHCLRGGLPDYPYYGARVSIAWDGRRVLEPLPLDDAQLAERRRRLARGPGGRGKGRRAGSSPYEAGSDPAWPVGRRAGFGFAFALALLAVGLIGWMAVTILRDWCWSCGG